MSIQIRNYLTSDECEVVELWMLVFPDEPAWNESKELIDRKLTVQPELFFVCVENKIIVGTTIAGFDGVRGWVHKVATHPEHRRKGISRALMRAAEKGLAKQGCTKLNIQVREGNIIAVEFYQSIGYNIEPRTSLGKHLG
ncbi:MAG: GNAT family acetyltransferase [Pseudomonadales bacterium]|nr:GNAT family acetyltransferase [Pseudomonadales bacterium]